MSDIDALQSKVAGWVQPLTDAAAPAGPDLEYDNDFLALTTAAAGKPESQFGAAEPPDWRAAADMAETLLERTRDLRVAVFWLRAQLHLQGYGALPAGLQLVSGLVESQWDHVHPLPDPDDNDPYARVNALTVLREPDGLVGDLRQTHVVSDRAIGEVSGRTFEVALGLAPARSGEADVGRDPLSQMLAAAVDKTPALRTHCGDALAATRRLITAVNDKLGIGTAPDLRPVYAIVNGIASLLPPEANADEAAAGSEAAGADGAEGGVAAASSRRGLSGGVSSREEAIRAIDMVCQYLERAEPTNPAPLFLRRAKHLINHNFLQLMKVLAPDSLNEVARVVGVDPDTVESPDGA